MKNQKQSGQSWLPKREILPEIIALTCFAILSTWMYFVHEPWADEAQAWLIASNFDNPFGMLSVAGYEGSPMLWHFILWVFAHLGLQMWSMRVFHLIISISTAFLILRYAPFERYQRFLSIFGYYFVFEYNTIARSYALTIFLLAYLGKFYKQRYDHQLRIGIILALIAQTNIHGLIFSVVIFGTMAVEKLFENWNIKVLFGKYYKIYIPFLTSLVFAIMVLLPPADLPEFIADWTSIRSNNPIGYAQFFTFRGFFPIQTTQTSFWSYDLRIAFISYEEAKSIANLLILLMFYQFVRKGYPLLFLFSTIIGYNILFVYKRGICPRHCGLIYVVYFFSYWYSLYYDDIKYTKSKIWRKIKTSFQRVNRKEKSDDITNGEPGKLAQWLKDIYQSKKIRSYIFTLFLVIQLLSMPIPVYHDSQQDFSNAENVANYLKDNGLISEDVLLAAHSWFPSIAIIPHLPEGHQELYFIQQEQYGTYIKWNDVFFDSIVLEPMEIVNRTVNHFEEAKYEQAVLVLSYEISDVNFLSYFEALVFFEHALVAEEDYYIYSLI